MPKAAGEWPAWLYIYDTNLPGGKMAKVLGVKLKRLRVDG
jgi:hypothetical protein